MAEKNTQNIVEQMGSRLGVIFQREMDPIVAGQESSKFLYETSYPDNLINCIDTLEILLKNPNTDKYAALSLAGLKNSSSQNKDYDIFLNGLLDAMIKSYYSMEKPDVEMKDRKFSAISCIISKCFIRLYE